MSSCRTLISISTISAYIEHAHHRRRRPMRQVQQDGQKQMVSSTSPGDASQCTAQEVIG